MFRCRNEPVSLMSDMLDSKSVNNKKKALVTHQLVKLLMLMKTISKLLVPLTLLSPPLFIMQLALAVEIYIIINAFVLFIFILIILHLFFKLFPLPQGHALWEVNTTVVFFFFFFHFWVCFVALLLSGGQNLQQRLFCCSCRLCFQAL